METGEIIAIFLAVVLIALVVMFTIEAVVRLFERNTWEPTEVYPMANANITWEQTYHAGAWNENVKGRK